VISINGQQYVPITKHKVEPVVIEGRSYIPVKPAPESLTPSKVIAPTKEGHITTFKMGN
jgi:uncharacterized lipoprotein NlpE involved in copper resistance